MRPFFKRLSLRFFGRPLDFRVRLFHILALGGAAISLLTLIISLVTSMWKTAALAGALALFSLGLILFTQYTGKYRAACFFTVAVIFMTVLPAMFFFSGGHRSGMPSIFVLAVIFTVLMIKGRAAIFISLLEIAEYSAVCVLVYRHPEFATHYKTEGQVLGDVIFAFACVSLICGVVLFFHLKQYDRERELLHEQNERLRRYDASRSAFLTTVSHEVKNPLNAINLYARDTLELMDEPEPDVQTVRGNQQVIEKMVARIDRILTDLKDTVAIEQGRLALTLAPVRLAGLINEVCGTYFGKDALGGSELEVNIEQGLPSISADYARVVQVVVNLLSNAAKHTHNGKITVSLFKRGSEQYVAVSDNGEGMSEQIREQAFKGYISSDEQYWRHGIGLYVSHQIVEAHGGRIWIESRQGSGTTVTFTLPEEGK